MFAREVSERLSISRAYGYRIVKQLNEELKEQGYLTIDGRTSRRYFDEKFYLKMW
ncbi:MAG: DNA-binding protein [Ruminococcus sp.]|nr:DNA-binding protein [Ruminococcus sp.]